jgi:hypothetical protein
MFSTASNSDPGDRPMPDTDLKSELLPGRDDRILLVGVARSGTSWLVRALSRSVDTRHYYEPDNVDADPTGVRPVGARGFGPYPVLLPDGNGEPFRPIWDAAFAGRLPRRRGLGLVAARTAARLPNSLRSPLVHTTSRVLRSLPGGPSRTVVKTIYAVFSLDWLVDRYDPRTLVLQRHPLNVVASWRELEIPMFDIAERIEIRRHFLEPLDLAPPPPGASELSRIAWHVGLLTTVVGDALDRHPGWMLLDHESLCVDPIPRIQDVFRRVGLPWTAEAETFLADNNRPGTGFQVSRVAKDQAERWRTRFTDAELREVTDVLAQFPRHGWVRPPAAETGTGDS